MEIFRACVLFVVISLAVESFLVTATPQIRNEPKRFKRSLHRKKRATHDVRNCESSPTYLPPTVIKTTDRLRELRNRMKEHRWDLDAYILSNTDPHLSEVPALRDRRLEFMSGFKGTYATAIVTKNEALLWTDARYWIQAEQQLDCNWELMKEGTIDEENDPNDPDLPDVLILSPVEWLLENMPVEAKIGFDPRLMSIDEYNHFYLTFEHYENKRISFVWIQEFTYPNDPEMKIYYNLIDHVWENEGSRPVYAREPLVTVDADTYTGETWEDKIFRYKDERSLRWIMKEKNVEALVITKLDEVAWLFNMRGADIPNNPLFLAYSIITLNDIRLYLYDIDWKKTREVENHLKIGEEYDVSCPEFGPKNPNCVSLRAYKDFLQDVHELLDRHQRIWITNSSSIAVKNASEPSPTALKDKRLIAQSPILRMRSVKSPEEIEGMKNAHIRDSVNFIKTASYIQETVEYQREQNKRLEPDDPDYRIYISEYDISKRLEEYRELELSYVMSAFPTVSAFGHHSAMVTYNVTEQSDIRVDETKLYLLEAGAHYVDGTTDIARTFWFEYKKTPPQYLRDQYTRVLMGLIDLSNTVFHTNIYGRDLDGIARRALWKNGLDYLHATGHGIGHYLSVNEGPIGFGLGYEVSEIPLERGMVMTNEPGYYDEDNQQARSYGQYGIRLEDVMVIVQANTNYTYGDYDWNTFETISLVPFEYNLIDYTMLNIEQIKWLNAYNKKIKNIIGPYLGSSTTTQRKWLDRRTKEITYKFSVSAAETTVSQATVTMVILCSVVLNLFL